jgi:hypothetical protein
MRFRPIRTIVVVLGLMLGASACIATPPPGTPLPDLGMAQIRQLTVTNPGDGTHALQFTTTVVNVGDADFKLQATRPNTSTPWTVNQLLPNGHGGFNSYPTSATYVYGGDGHNHWHVHGLASYNLYAMPSMTFTGTVYKSGFCFFDVVPYDLTIPGAPQGAVYNSLDCGGINALESSMGLSIGWGDQYPKSLPGQSIDITGLAAGKYRLAVTADAGKVFYEKTRTNDTNWIDFSLRYGQLGNAIITVTGAGPLP